MGTEMYRGYTIIWNDSPRTIVNKAVVRGKKIPDSQAYDFEFYLERKNPNLPFPEQVNHNTFNAPSLSEGLAFAKNRIDLLAGYEEITVTVESVQATTNAPSTTQYNQEITVVAPLQVMEEPLPLQQEEPAKIPGEEKRYSGWF